MCDSLSWLSVYLYYGEPLEDLLTNALMPFVADTRARGLVNQFFFIRYWERGPHIRLRLKGQTAIIERILKPQLESFFCTYFREYPSKRKDVPVHTIQPSEQLLPNNSLQFLPYEPELERYGGPTGTEIAEIQFQLSSQTVLQIIGESHCWGYDRALGSALQLHLGFSFALGMSLVQARQFYSYISRNQIYPITIPARSHPNKAMPQVQIQELYESKFRDQEHRIVPYLGSLWNAFNNKAEFEHVWLNEWVSQMFEIAEQFSDARIHGRLLLPPDFGSDFATHVPSVQRSMWPILQSLVHMTNNRLGVFNQDEGYLSYLMQRALEYL